jgi:hypothetical protein
MENNNRDYKKRLAELAGQRGVDWLISMIPRYVRRNICVYEDYAAMSAQQTGLKHCITGRQVRNICGKKPIPYEEKKQGVDNKGEQQPPDV